MSTRRRSQRSSLQFGHFTENPAAYVAAELPRQLPEEFVIGDNGTYRGYLNPSLREGAVYDIYIGAVSRINDTVKLEVICETVLSKMSFEIESGMTRCFVPLLVACVIVVKMYFPFRSLLWNDFAYKSGWFTALCGMN